MAESPKRPDRPSGQYSQTHVGPGERLVLRPGARTAPKLPELPPPEPPPSEGVQTPRSGELWVEPIGASVQEVEALEQAARSRGARVVRSPVTQPEPTSRGASYAEPPWWRTAKGVAAVLGALGTFSGVAAFAIVQIVNAVHQPSVADEQIRELKAESDVRKAEARAREVTDAERERARQQQINDIHARLRELDLRYPAPKVNPRRAPQPAPED